MALHGSICNLTPLASYTNNFEATPKQGRYHAKCYKGVARAMEVQQFYVCITRVLQFFRCVACSVLQY